MILKIVIAPDPILKKIAKPVNKIDEKLKKILMQMLDLMYESNGIGLAAPQVGISKRFFVMDNPEENKLPYFFINPVIIKKSKDISEFAEGCLSVPIQRITIYRPESIELEYLDINGKKQIESFNGLNATCIQHEIDHLNGIIITDYIESKEEYKEVLKKLNETKKKMQKPQ